VRIAPIEKRGWCKPATGEGAAGTVQFGPAPHLHHLYTQVKEKKETKIRMERDQVKQKTKEKSPSKDNGAKDQPMKEGKQKVKRRTSVDAPHVEEYSLDREAIPQGVCNQAREVAGIVRVETKLVLGFRKFGALDNSYDLRAKHGW